MRTLSYSPSVRLYAMHVGKGGSREYYDLSGDVVSCSVSLMENGSGTLTARLQNRGGKYDGKFLPMDVVVASCDSHKGETRLFTGYVNTVKGFSLYPGDYTLTASDSLYRLQRLYWDPSLYPSWYMVHGSAYADYTEKGDMGAADAIRAVLGNVAGMDGTMVDVGDIPNEMAEFAKDVWKSDRKGYARQEALAQELLDVLRSSSAPVSGGASGTSSTAGRTGVTVPATWKGHPEIVNTALTQIGLPYASADDPSYGHMDCSGLVCWAYRQHGIDLVSMGARTAEQITMLPHKEVKEGDAKAGDLVSWYGEYGGYGRSGPYWFHIAIYDGNGKVVEETPPECVYREVYDMGEYKMFFHPDVLDTIPEVR